jgi:phage terminase large subunit-like protein
MGGLVCAFDANDGTKKNKAKKSLNHFSKQCFDILNAFGYFKKKQESFVLAIISTPLKKLVELVLLHLLIGLRNFSSFWCQNTVLKCVLF